ncbi:hypothetical protein GCM10010401_06860 [Rarobacter faecitabidus]|uniref:histidine kinase n=1 Tax=Rarobacter faecitabidus TaxID=13243 RepID=A0A542ZTH5_RARFA|nr:hypothetical protein [Rarobacter faecitabidus]TQL63566.1 signal transduction histidine kinase [Rarobacter faecitabidus]
MITWFGGLGSTFTMMGLIQAYYLATQIDVPSNIQGAFWLRVLASLLPLWIAAVCAERLQLWRMASRRQRVVYGSAIVLIAACIRVYLQSVFEVYAVPDQLIISFEIAGGAAMFGVACLFTVAFIRLQRKERHLAIESERHRLAGFQAIEALHNEEIRVHRSVSEALHGTVQQRFVILEASVRSVLDSGVLDGDALDIARDQLEELARGLVAIRDDTVRVTSRLLSPDGLEIGLRGAIRILLGRIPAPIRTSMVVDEPTKRIDDVTNPGFTPSQRLLTVRFIEEAVTNALKHGHANSVAVYLVTVLDDQAAPSEIRVAVENDGLPWNAVSSDGSGIAALRQRIEVAGGSLLFAGTNGETTRVEMSLPLTKM